MIRNRYLFILVVAFVVLAFDQATKFWVLAAIPEYTEIPLIEGFFSLVHVRNRGAAFGFLNRHDISWQFWLFLAATVAAVVVVYCLARSAREDERGLFAALGLILGGAAGNLVDRILYRSVIDFLDFFYKGWHWPAFNVADIAICCGAGLAFFFAWRKDMRSGIVTRN